MIKDIDKWTERARRVITLAESEARRSNRHYVGSEHILLGLLVEKEGVAAKVLANLGVELPKVRAAVEFTIGHGEGSNTDEGSLTLSARAKEVIYQAMDEARRRNHHYLGTEHLLLGLLREGEGVAARVLESMGVTLQKAREATATGFNQSERSSMFKIQTDLKYTVTFDGESVFLLRRVCEVSQHVLNQVNQGLTAPLGMAQEKREELSSFIQEILDRTQG